MNVGNDLVKEYEKNTAQTSRRVETSRVTTTDANGVPSVKLEVKEIKSSSNAVAIEAFNPK